MISLLLFGALLSRPVEITADKLEVLDREHKAVYRGHARALRVQRVDVRAVKMRERRHTLTALLNSPI